MEEQKEGPSIHGVMLGRLQTSNGDVLIGMTVVGGQVALTPHSAAIVFDQLGDLLESIGFFDEEDEVEDEEEKGPTCH